MDTQNIEPLNVAVLNSPLEVLMERLSYPISPSEIKDPNTQASILCWVAQRKNDDEACKISRVLVEQHGVDPTDKDTMLQNCLFYSAREGLTQLSKYYIEKGCDPNDRDKVFQTPLFYAARDGRTDTVLELLRCGGDPNQLDNNRQSCLFYAARDGRYETVKVLLQNGANHLLKDAQRRTVITFARGNGHLSIVELLKQASNTKTTTHSQSTRNTSPVISTPSIVSSSITSIDSPSLTSNNENSLTTSKEGFEIQDKFENGLINAPPDQEGNLSQLVFSTEENNQVRTKRTLSDVSSQKDNQPRQKYRLQFNPHFENVPFWMDAPLTKVIEFEKQFPHLSSWSKDMPISPLNPSFIKFRKDWTTASLELLSSLSKYLGGNLFEKLVDPKKQNCPQYYEIIKNPISISCIRAKLKKDEYTSPHAFLADVQLIFDNCALYNHKDSLVAITGKTIEKYFNNQLIVTNFARFTQLEELITKELNHINSITAIDNNQESDLSNTCSTNTNHEEENDHLAHPPQPTSISSSESPSYDFPESPIHDFLQSNNYAQVTTSSLSSNPCESVSNITNDLSSLHTLTTETENHVYAAPSELPTTDDNACTTLNPEPEIEHENISNLVKISTPANYQSNQPSNFPPNESCEISDVQDFYSGTENGINDCKANPDLATTSTTDDFEVIDGNLSHLKDENNNFFEINHDAHDIKEFIIATNDPSSASTRESPASNIDSTNTLSGTSATGDNSPSIEHLSHSLSNDIQLNTPTKTNTVLSINSSTSSTVTNLNSPSSIQIPFSPTMKSPKEESISELNNRALSSSLSHTCDTIDRSPQSTSNNETILGVI